MSTTKDDAAVPGGLQVIARTAQILRMLDAQRADIRINDVAEELGIGRTTAHRYLQSLAAEGFLDRVGDGSYRLGPLLAGLGASVLSQTRVVEVGGPFLEQLADTTGETSVLGIWTGANAVAVLCKEPPGKSVNMTVRIGAPLTACAAQSLMFLEHLPDRMSRAALRRVPADRRAWAETALEAARRDGYVLSDAEIPGVSAIAAPVFEGGGRIAATVALVAPSTVLQTEPGGAHSRALLATARSISSQLGYVPLPSEAAETA